jgi:HEAT repeat protein
LPVKLDGVDSIPVCYWAASSLGKLHDARAVEPLIPLLKARNADVRLAAVWALEEIGDARALVNLVQAINDNDERVRKAVIHALEKFNLKLT